MKLVDDAISSLREIEKKRRVSTLSTTVLELPEESDKIIVAGEAKEMSELALRNLCWILKVPYPVDRYLGEKYPEMRKKILDGIRKNVDVRIQVVSYNGNVQAILPENYLLMSNTEFVERVWDALTPEVKTVFEENPDSANIIWDTYHGGMDAVLMQFFDPNAKEIMTADKFRHGVTIRNSATYQFPIETRRSYQRDFCTNACMSGTAGYRMRHAGRTTRELREFLSRPIQEVFGMNWEGDFRNRVVLMQNITLSLREVLHYNRYLSDFHTEEGETKISRLPEKLPTVQILARHNINVDQLVGRKKLSDRWMSTAETPVTAYYLYDFMTQEAKHNESLNAREKVSLQMTAGDLLSRKFDMSDIAPRVKFDSNLVRYQPVVGAQN